MNKKTLLQLCLTAIVLLTACNESNEPTNNDTPGGFFIAVAGDDAEYILTNSDPTQGLTSIADNQVQLELTGYTWIFSQKTASAVGLIYQQGDPGIGLVFQLDPLNQLIHKGSFQNSDRFTSYGFFDHYALMTVGGQVPLDNNGQPLLDVGGNNRTDGVTVNFVDLNGTPTLQPKYMTTLNITGNGDQATLSGIVDNGNGEFLTGLVVSAPKDPNATGGASSGTITYPDSVWVAAIDKDLNVKRIYRDDRISYCSGRFRSAYYSQIGIADDGTTYVFSGAYESTTTKPAAALRINKNTTDFDKDYYFNIQALSQYKFRKVWHATANFFLLECYNDLIPTATGAATQYGIVDAYNKTFQWVTGIPDKEQITNTGLPTTHNGNILFPITAAGQDPTIYVIDPTTAIANKGLAVQGATNIAAIGKLTPQ